MQCPRGTLLLVAVVTVPCLVEVSRLRITAEQAAIVPRGSSIDLALRALGASGFRMGIVVPTWLVLEPTKSALQRWDTMAYAAWPEECVNLDTMVRSAFERIAALRLMPSPGEQSLGQCALMGLAFNLCSNKSIGSFLTLQSAEIPKERLISWFRGYCPGVCGPPCNATAVRALLSDELFTALRRTEDFLWGVAEEVAGGPLPRDPWVFQHIGRFQGARVQAHEARLFVRGREDPKDHVRAEGYRGVFASMSNASGGAVLLKVELPFDPMGDTGERWATKVQAGLHDRVLGSDFKATLRADIEQVLEASDRISADAPVSVAGATLAMAVLTAALFRSASVPVRLMFTVLVTLVWTYASLKLIFVDWIGLNGVYWAIPPCVTPVLVGLVLDYDLFLLTRVLEFRTSGLSTRDALRLGVEKTQASISTAGLIMALAFSSLCFSELYILREFGALLVIGTLLDAFIVRPLVVPACVLAFGDPEWTWWPRRLPPVQCQGLAAPGPGCANGDDLVELEEIAAGAYALAPPTPR